MSGFLVDTNVVSELRKGTRCDARVRAWFEAVSDSSLYLSVLVLGELRRGIEGLRSRDPEAAKALDRWAQRIEHGYAERVLPIDRAVTAEWGRLDATFRVPVVDGLLAATARVHGLTLVTRNTKDVARTGVDVLNPFAAP